MKDSPVEANERYHQFLSEVVRTGVVWALWKGSGWACREVEEKTVLPVWSFEAGAVRCAESSFPESAPVSFSLAEFRDDWLPDLKTRDYWVGVNLRENLDGIDVRPDVLARELRDADA
jgi:hypothetical protein